MIRLDHRYLIYYAIDFVALYWAITLEKTCRFFDIRNKFEYYPIESIFAHSRRQNSQYFSSRPKDYSSVPYNCVFTQLIIRH